MDHKFKVNESVEWLNFLFNSPMFIHVLFVSGANLFVVIK